MPAGLCSISQEPPAILPWHPFRPLHAFPWPGHCVLPPSDHCILPPLATASCPPLVTAIFPPLVTASCHPDHCVLTPLSLSLCPAPRSLHPAPLVLPGRGSAAWDRGDSHSQPLFFGSGVGLNVTVRSLVFCDPPSSSHSSSFKLSLSPFFSCDSLSSRFLSLVLCDGFITKCPKNDAAGLLADPSPCSHFPPRGERAGYLPVHLNH